MRNGIVITWENTTQNIFSLSHFINDLSAQNSSIKELIIRGIIAQFNQLYKITKQLLKEIVLQFITDQFDI